MGLLELSRIVAMISVVVGLVLIGNDVHTPGMLVCIFGGLALLVEIIVYRVIYFRVDNRPRCLRFDLDLDLTTLRAKYQKGGKEECSRYAMETVKEQIDYWIDRLVEQEEELCE